jgi:hypothetical protein
MKRFKTSFLPGLLILSCRLFAQSPGGIVNQSIWLNGSFSSDTAQQSTLNFNPALATDDSKARIKLPGKIESLSRSTIFTVYQNNVAEEERPVWEITGDFGDLLLSTRQVSSNSRKTNIVFSIDKPRSYKPEKSEAIIHTYLNYGGKFSPSENTVYKEASIRLGNSNSSLPVNSSANLISEFILYEKILSEVEITKVETYLALKYGITLEKNYLNALGGTVWNWKNDTLFSNNIAGIGRDDQSALYQKQGTSCNTPGQLVIGINKIAESNYKNTGQINDRDYLIWGDNAKNFIWEQNAEAAACEIMLAEKKWLIKPSGSSANKISTELKIDTKTLLPGYFPKESFYLIIDRSGSGDFVSGNCTYISPDSISSDGIASFSHIYWDADDSGKDLFTFGFKPMLTVSKANSKSMNSIDAAGHISFHLYPNPVTSGHYNMAVNMDKPTDIQIQVYDLNQHLLDSKKGSGQVSYLFSGYINVPSGSYFVRLITPETELYRILIVQ